MKWVGITWSRYKTLAKRFHEKGFDLKSKVHGPFPINTDATEENPGPPPSQRINGSFSGAAWDSKSQ
ncbi:hypothetical protein DSO57_1039451 [Entomophthora muscae]|uniref:Uncharacterized protein n=1 Tax=Entomophthora muscae TaxID=34485 RepID=A0ACC2SMJ3_9FUNG|nr:hypothetical protein DSO57_1039451 [Entomophthora muscae]